MILAIDIISFKRTTYGRAGDYVELISRHESVLVVEDRNGNRFPVCENELLVVESEPGITVAPRAPATAKSKKKESVPSKTVLPGQQNLF